MSKPAPVTNAVTATSIAEPHLSGLLPALQRLDNLLERAVAAANAAYGLEASRDSFRGLHISQGDVARLLAREPGVPMLYTDGSQATEGAPGPDGRNPHFTWLAQVFALSAFDLDVALIALAPELDLRYERLYAYLQDDVTRRRPSVDLVLNLLCPTADSKLAQHSRFAADAPLIRHGILRLIREPQQLEPPLLAHFLKLDEQIIRFILGHDYLDSRLGPFSKLVDPSRTLRDLAVDENLRQEVRRLAAAAKKTQRPLRLCVRGGTRIDRQRAAEALAGELCLRVLCVDLPRVLGREPDFERALDLLLREAWFKGAALYLDGVDAFVGSDRELAYLALFAKLEADAGVTILGSGASWRAEPSKASGLDLIGIDLSSPRFEERVASWRSCLDGAGIVAGPSDVEALADRFKLTPVLISEAVRTAEQRALARADATVGAGDLFAGARAQCSQDIARLARKVDARHYWCDIVLPDDTMAQLREIVQRVARRRRVMDEWEFGRKLSLGKGVTALFSGPSGTGKTLAAEILTGELGLELYKIDLAGVVSKYIGETEKNLDRVFAAAENAGAILFFDEADALFGKRSEVRDSHDRYANVEISYLLQKMEEYEGIAILATNLRANLDEAFLRRLAFVVHFPFPDEASRRRIWDGIWPAALPRAADLDTAALARDFKLSGGHIRNVALAAAFLAAEEESQVTHDHVLHAIRREYQKLGKRLSGAEMPERVAQ